MIHEAALHPAWHTPLFICLPSEGTGLAGKKLDRCSLGGMGRMSVEPQLLAKISFFTQKWKETFLPRLVRKRAGIGARGGVIVYLLLQIFPDAG